MVPCTGLSVFGDLYLLFNVIQHNANCKQYILNLSIALNHCLLFLQLEVYYVDAQSWNTKAPHLSEKEP